MIFGNKKPKFEGEGTCIFIGEYGAPSIRIFKIIKTEGKFTTIGFSPQDQYTIPTKNIRVKRTILWKTPSGKIISQDPDAWGDIDLNAQNIKILRFNLQNFSLQEKKAALHRWTLPSKLSDKLITIFKILFISIAVGVIGWASFKGMIYIFDKVMASRILDCAQLVQKIPNPIGAIVNAPIGA